MARVFNKQMAKHLCVYVKCPTSGKTLDGVRGDDKVLCNCPAAASRGGTHIVAQCSGSTVERWMEEHGISDKGGE
jgi:hypothetical protein